MNTAPTYRAILARYTDHRIAGFSEAESTAWAANDMKVKVTDVIAARNARGEQLDSPARQDGETSEAVTSPVRSAEIWNTHYQGKGNNWRATIIFVDGTRKSTTEVLTFAQVSCWISCYQASQNV